MKVIFFLLLEIFQINRIFRHLNRGKVKTLLYHSISPRGKYFANGVSPVEFARQLRYLKKYFHVISSAELDNSQAYSTDRINIVITFDDGFKDNRTVATELLRREGLTATFFAIAACVPTGRAPDFVPRDHVDSMAASEFHTIDSDDIQQMLACGMTLGSHGTDHGDYAKWPFEQGMDDAVRSRSTLEALAPDAQVECFAFPWGRFRSGQETALLGTFRRVFLTTHGFNQCADRVMNRNEVFDTPQLWAAASGALDFFRGIRGGPRHP